MQPADTGSRLTVRAVKTPQGCWILLTHKRRTRSVFTGSFKKVLILKKKEREFFSSLLRVPLSMLCHIDSPPGRDRWASVRDTEDLHGLPLWSPLAMTIQHGRVHSLPRRICVWQKKTWWFGINAKHQTRVHVSASISMCCSVLCICEGLSDV